MNDQLDLDDGTADRLRRYLDLTAHHIHLPNGNASTVRKIAHRRTIRRRRAFTGTVAAATVGTMVIGLQRLSTVPNDEPAAEAPSASVDATASPALQPDALPVHDAQPADPQFVWKAVDPGEGHGIVMAFGPMTSMTGLALSTAPGQRTGDGIDPTVWRTADGITWEPTSLDLPFNLGNFEATSTPSALYAVGTAPGIAATEPNPLQLAIARPGSEEWNTIDLPIDTNNLGDAPFLVPGLQRSVAGLDDGSALVAVTTRPHIDMVQLSEHAGFKMESIVSVTDDGVGVVADGCPNSTVPTATIAESADTLVVTTDAESPECGTTLMTWEALGVPSESVAAMNDATTEFFKVSVDGAFEPVESPAPGEMLSATYGQGEAVFTVQTTSATEETYWDNSFRYAGGQWQAMQAHANWSALPSRLGDATLGWSHMAGRGTIFARASDSGEVTYTDLTSMLPDYAFMGVAGQAATGDAVVSAAAIDRDWVAAEGGISVNLGAVTVRHDSIEEDRYFVETADGTRIPEERIVWGDTTMTFRDANGDELATIAMADVDQATTPPEGQPIARPWSLITTTDGASFSVESVADLLGIEDDQISNVARVASDGTQVVVAVTLTDTYADGMKKQMVLVGTPIG